MADEKSTKQAIFEAAAELFAREHYHNVSMKQIASAVGIRAPSIYSHYPSKEAILRDIFRFFDEKMNLVKPDLGTLLSSAETEHPHQVLRRISKVFPTNILPVMSDAMLTALSMMRIDPAADLLIYRNLIYTPFEYDVPLLEKMQLLGRIEPIDTHQFALLHSSYCYSAALRFCTNHALDTPTWLAGMDLLFSIVKPTV